MPETVLLLVAVVGGGHGAVPEQVYGSSRLTVL